MDASTLQLCTGCSSAKAQEWLEPITAAMAAQGIGAPARAAAFLAQIGHESGGLVYTSEIWGPTVAQLRYEGRVDLGNTQPGDGSLFRGRGLIQITGRANYDKLGAALCWNCVANPEMVAEPNNAALSAAWWWVAHGLNPLADKGNFLAITKIINGGMNGYTQRLALWQSAKQALGVVS